MSNGNPNAPSPSGLPIAPPQAPPAPVVLNEHEVKLETLMKVWQEEEGAMRAQAKVAVRADAQAKAANRVNAYWLRHFQPLFTEWLDIEACYTAALKAKAAGVPQAGVLQIPPLTEPEKTPLIDRATYLIGQVKSRFEAGGATFQQPFLVAPGNGVPPLIAPGAIGGGSRDQNPPPPPTARFAAFVSWFKWQVSAVRSAIQRGVPTSALVAGSSGGPGGGGGPPGGGPRKARRRRRGRRVRRSSKQASKQGRLAKTAAAAGKRGGRKGGRKKGSHTTPKTLDDSSASPVSTSTVTTPTLGSPSSGSSGSPIEVPGTPAAAATPAAGRGVQNRPPQRTNARNQQQPR